MCIYAEICTHTLCAKKHFLVLLGFLIWLVACMVLSSSDVSCQAASGHLHTYKGYKMKSHELSASRNLENHLSGQCRRQDTCTFMLSIDRKVVLIEIFWLFVDLNLSELFKHCANGLSERFGL